MRVVAIKEIVALNRSTDDTAMLFMTIAFKDVALQVRQTTLNALSQFTQASPGVLDQLQQLKRDPNILIRGAAIHAAERLTRSSHGVE